MRKLLFGGMLALSSLSIACGSDDPGSEGNGSTSGEADSDGMADSTNGTGETEEPATISCTATSGDHAADCPDECAIAFDAVVTCEPGVGLQGLRVGPRVGETGVHFYAADARARAGLFGSLADEDAVQTVQYSSHYADSPHWTMAPDGEPFVVFDTHTHHTTYDGLSVLAPLRAPNDQFTIVDLGFTVARVYGAAHDQDGRLHVFSPTDGGIQQFRGRFGSPFDVLATSAPIGHNDGTVFGLEADGTAVGLAHTTGLDLVRFVGGTATIGEDVGTIARLAFMGEVVPPAQPSLPEGAPAYLAYGHYGNVVSPPTPFRVFPSEESGLPEMLVDVPPNSDLVESCSGGDEKCPAECEVSQSYVAAPNVGVARTSDGRVWAAWLMTHEDRTAGWQLQCSPEDTCHCNGGHSLRDDSWGEMVLAELDLEAGTTHEVLRLTVESPFLLSRSTFPRRGFHLYAHGTDLALGVATTLALGVGNTRLETTATNLRLVRVDTLQIAD